MIAISYDSVDILQQFASKNKITFPLLSDPGSHVIKSFGLLNQSPRTERQGGIAHPLTVLVGKDQKVLGRIEATVRVRHTAKQLIKEWRAVGTSN